MIKIALIYMYQIFFVFGVPRNGKKQAQSLKNTIMCRASYFNTSMTYYLHLWTWALVDIIWWRNNRWDLHLLKRENKGYWSTTLWMYKRFWFFHWIKFTTRKIFFVCWFFRKHGTTTTGNNCKVAEHESCGYDVTKF